MVAFKVPGVVTRTVAGLLIGVAAADTLPASSAAMTVNNAPAGTLAREQFVPVTVASGVQFAEFVPSAKSGAEFVR